MNYSIEKLVFYLRGLFSAPIICESFLKKKIFKFSKNKAIFDQEKLDKIKGKKRARGMFKLSYKNKFD